MAHKKHTPPTPIAPGVAHLSSGETLLFSEEDKEVVYGGIWYCTPSQARRGPHNRIFVDGKPVLVTLSRAIGERVAGRSLSDDEMVFNRTNDPLDLTRENLYVDDKRAEPCPVTPARIREMYEEQLMSLTEIMDALEPLYGKRPTQKSVEKWLRAAGVTFRTESEAQRIWRQKRPESVARSVNAMVKARDEQGRNAGNPEALRKRTNRRKAVAARRPEWQAKHVTCTCSWCGKSFERLKSLVERQKRNSGSDALYCSKSHANKARWQRAFVEKARVAAREKTEFEQYLEDAAKRIQEENQ